MKNLDLEFFLFLHEVIAPKRLKIDCNGFLRKGRPKMNF